RSVMLILTDGTSYSATKAREAETSRFFGDVLLPLDPQTVFGKMELLRGLSEKTIAELRKDIEEKKKANLSPHNEIMYIQQKFSIPIACLVFAIIGLALGMTVARDGKLAGFVLGIIVIFAYYVTMYLAEALAKGAWIKPELARWVPNILLGVAG